MVEQIKFELGETNEVTLRFAGETGAKGEGRAPKRKRTPEDMERQNRTNRSNYLRRKIMLNFKAGDLWTTLKYPAGTKKTADELKADWDSFRTAIRKEYRRVGYEAKFIYRLEIGKKGGAHIHLLINRIPEAERLLDEAWTHGRVYRGSVYEEGGCRQLADYITKSDEVLAELKAERKRLKEQTEGQIGMFDEGRLEDIEAEIRERSKLRAYGCSRNLIRPEDVKTKKTFSHWTLRALFDGDMPKASKGFEVEKDSVYFGVNPFTGLSYVTYTERKVRWNTAKNCRKRRMSTS